LPEKCAAKLVENSEVVYCCRLRVFSQDFTLSEALTRKRTDCLAEKLQTVTDHCDFFCDFSK